MKMLPCAAETIPFDQRRNIAMAVEKRLLSLAPESYDKTSRTIRAVISRGSAVQRFYGVEVLRISAAAIDLKRVFENQVPVLDSHQQIGLTNALGVVRHAWVERDALGPALVGELSFNDTEEGRRAEGMVARSELTGISAGYRVSEWQIKDGDGRIVDPVADTEGWRDNDLQFEGVRWELLEVSLCLVPADAGVGFRSDRALPSASSKSLEAYPRMLCRQRMIARHVAAVLGR